MGFRSTFVSDDSNYRWPEWFRDKYRQFIHFPVEHGPISSKYDVAIYDGEIFKDIQKALPECGSAEIRIVMLHECGGVTAVDISATGIVYSEPDHFTKVDFITHNYCYGCSEPWSAENG